MRNTFSIELMLSTSRRLVVGLIAGAGLLPGGCSDAGSDEPAPSGTGSSWTSTGATPNEGETALADGEGGVASHGEDGGSDDDGDGEPRFDVGGVGTGAGATAGEPEQGCEKIDFLFVVDNSGSMTAYQERMTNAIPAFISAIEDGVGVDDVHIIAVDTDAAPTECLAACEEHDAESCNNASCQALAALTGCEIELGAGRTVGSDGMPCPLPGPQRYITGIVPDLAETFACMAHQGGGQGTERQMQAMVAAVSDGMVREGACNAGFLRDDAVLMVTFITDERDSSQDAPQTWFDAMIAAKHGDPDAVVVLGIVDDPVDQAKQVEFVEAFAHGRIVNIDQPDYTPDFVEIASEVIIACETFDPVG